MRYKIIVQELLEYPETETIYESKTSGKRFYSRYSDEIEKGKEGVDFVTKEQPTGKMLDRTKEVYSQEVEMPNITDVIKAANGLLR